ncbi:MAG TPA: glycosyltransferase [Acidobacteriaceae bacterium]|jgi:phosphatidylinositol alpha 1,6-mannosyltransferase|nr:glycosyltransferase [Acidobacteriaceae bacterium]
MRSADPAVELAAEQRPGAIRPPLRVAYFPDSFHEVNGVAHTSRHFEGFARRRELPFLCVRAAQGREKLRSERLSSVGPLTTLEFARGALSFPLDKDLRFDPGWIGHLPAMLRAVRAFRPDIVHVTGPSECGLLGAWVAHELGVPLAASWHTNVHEYAAKRSRWLLDRLPARQRAPLSQHIEDAALQLACVFYRWARVLFAPNLELCSLLEQRTDRPCHLMQRGVDTQAFSPAFRDRDPTDTDFVLGFVGRMSIEKNVALLVRVQQELEARGLCNFHFRIVGQGIDEPWLRQHLPRAEFPGVLRGDALARAYAGMDVFVFPSHTDTFGNVVLEAMASGVPAIVTPDGGPKTLVRDGATGFVAADADFSAAVAQVLNNPALHASMRVQARHDAMNASWDAVFEKVYAAYLPVALSGSAINAA